jgi:ankyrin repeat protein
MGNTSQGLYPIDPTRIALYWEPERFSWHYGVENEHGLEFMEFLLHNQPPNVGPNLPNADGETPLMKAVRSGRFKDVISSM